MKGKPMTTPTFDTIEAQASYGIGLQVGQQLSDSGLQGLLPEALVAGIADALAGKQPAVPVDGGGWIEALTLMPVGSKWELTIPHELAYGERGAGASIPPFSTLVFEVELLEIL